MPTSHVKKRSCGAFWSQWTIFCPVRAGDAGRVRHLASAGGRSGFALRRTACRQGWWRGLDSNQRTLARADLQSAAFNHSATSPDCGGPNGDAAPECQLCGASGGVRRVKWRNRRAIALKIGHFEPYRLAPGAPAGPAVPGRASARRGIRRIAGGTSSPGVLHEVARMED